jgi:hypothetical protein
MKTTKKHKVLTLGDLVQSSCHAWGKRRAQAILRLAATARLIVFPKKGRLAFS